MSRSWKKYSSYLIYIYGLNLSKIGLVISEKIEFFPPNNKKKKNNNNNNYRAMTAVHYSHHIPDSGVRSIQCTLLVLMKRKCPRFALRVMDLHIYLDMCRYAAKCRLVTVSQLHVIWNYSICFYSAIVCCIRRLLTT